MYQGTTPTIPITFEKIDLTSAKIFITIEDEGKKHQLTFVSGEDFEVEFEDPDTTGSIHLTQEQTLAMCVGECTAQARFIFPDGNAGITEKAKIDVNSALLKDVISYG